jgi:D-alanyl-D-alanine carboxypeptidase
MSDLHVLQPGHRTREGSSRRARQRRRRRRARRAIGVLAVIAVVLLVLDVSQSGEPSTQARRAAQSQHAVHRISQPKRPTSPIYGQTADAVQVRKPKLRLGLRSGLLFDVRSGRVLWQKDPTHLLPIASLTKMMTALVAVERSRPSDRVMITREATRFTGSGVGLLPRGKRVPELALLYGLLLPSGNDAAVALAQHVAGNQARFVAMMNAQARHLGLTCTHFSNVSGVVDRGNYSCARDLAVLAHAVLSQPLLKRIVASRSAIMRFPIKGGKLYLYNNNPLLMIRYPGADGVKTGFTDASGLCLVASARRGRHWLGVVLLHSGNWTAQAITLLNDGFAALHRR